MSKDQVWKIIFPILRTDQKNIKKFMKNLKFYNFFFLTNAISTGIGKGVGQGVLIPHPG